ncbi:DNA-binding response regulator [Streptomyces sp. ms191]|uniref:response regulator transcription factor n=1 Tax=Streptomyces sp. ms191 TaxID=1827978 RepID=UPI0011CE78AB|nr:response regulator transcription factor [Streptomyces sp. ms191]TXS29854.1 DNA-binding response regulator [Streptomyces sp. ms191]
MSRTDRSLRVVLAEDSVLLREGLIGLLARFGHEVVAAVGDADALGEAVAAHRPDIVVTDVRMPPGFHRVADGGTVVDPEVVRQLLRRRRDPLEALTPREREVLALVAEGHSNGEIARRLVVTEAAVGKHIGNILGKLNLPPAEDTHRRVLAVLTYLRA